MDSYTQAKLDKNIEILRDHSEILRQILDRVTALTIAATAEKASPERRIFSAKMKLSPFWQMIAGGVVSWSIGTAISSYLKHGGDPMALIALLLKSLL